MKMIGLIGGMSWESTSVYYRRLNEQIRSRLGGLHSANVIMRSVDFDEIVVLQRAGNWEIASEILSGIAKDLETAGADCVLICTNTMHKLADQVQATIHIPLLNIIDITANAVKSARASRPLVLATKYTMEEEFYGGRLRARHGLFPLVPDAEDRACVHNVIFDELCCGRIYEQSRDRLIEIVKKGCSAGADSVIFGCTEIGLLVGPERLDVPVFDSTLLHSDEAVAFSLGDRELIGSSIDELVESQPASTLAH